MDYAQYQAAEEFEAGSTEKAVRPCMDDVDLDRHQRRVLDEWTRLANGEKMPLRRALRPERLGSALGASMLLGVAHVDGEIVFQQRIEGHQVAAAFGEGNGRRLESIYTPDHLRTALPAYLEVATTGYPMATRGLARMEDGSEFTYSRLILPMAEADGSVSRLLTVFSFDQRALARRAKPLPIQRSPRTLDLLQRLSA